VAAEIASATDDQPPRVIAPPPGPRSIALAGRLLASECPAFADRRKARGDADALPITLAHGRGANIFDVDDNRYVDLAAGFGAAILGHGPSAAHAAVHAQVDRLAQGLGDLFASDVKIELCERLGALHPEPGARVLFGQSGADAVTAALKTALLASGRPGVLAFEGAYHGLSYAPLAACGFRPSFREAFAEQLNAHVVFARYPKRGSELDGVLSQVEARLAEGTIGAVLVEPLLGRGGVRVPPAGFLQALGDLAKRHGALVIADEIWTGIGRSGSLLASVAAGLVPDLICVGKGLGASFPISACIGSEAVMQAWSRGGEVLHTSTHAGAPIGCAAALATLNEVATRGLARRARTLGERLRAELRTWLASSRSVVEVRGRGLIVGIELTSGALGLSMFRKLLEHGYLVTVGGRAGEVLVLTPPLTIDEPILLGVAPVLSDLLAREAS
jgi:4-aminobutyrate aminotransferase / (S)-3-amino-2-methylpropionate transaminase / 5-aminovalerate transaminase